MEWTTLLFIVYYLVVLAVCVRVIFDTQPAKAFAYLFFIAMFPLLGVLIYFLIGINYRKNKLYKRKLTRDRKVFEGLEERIERSRNILKDNKTELAHFYPLAKMTNALGKNLATSENKIQLLKNGEEKFPDVMECLKNAKNHIHIEYYIYENDEIGNQIADILVDKAKEGIKIRFIYDGYGSRNISKIVKKLQNAGIGAVAFNGSKWYNFATRLNYRNHRKIIVIDGWIGYTGGINVSDKYINGTGQKIFWRDDHLKLIGPAVFNLQSIFLADWNFCTDEDPLELNEALFPNNAEKPSAPFTMAQIVSSGPDSTYPNIQFGMVQTILLAQNEIFITTPYFVPEQSIIDALSIAALSGVSIKLLVPSVSDSLILNAASRSFYGDLLRTGIEVYTYKKGFVHAKTMVCDAFVSFIGTANIDQRSFDLNFEVNAIFYNKVFANEIRFNFLNDLEHSEKLEYDTWKGRPLYIKLWERVVRLFSPML